MSQVPGLGHVTSYLHSTLARPENKKRSGFTPSKVTLWFPQESVFFVRALLFSFLQEAEG